MQRAYTTSLQAARLLAEAETIMSAARRNDPALPAHGAPAADMTVGPAPSLDVLVAPRACEMHIAGHGPYTLDLTPRENTDIASVIDQAMRTTTAKAPVKAPAPKPDANF